MQYNPEILENLRDNPFVVAPQWKHVRNLLRDIDIYHLYVPRNDDSQKDAMWDFYWHYRQWIKPYCDLSEFDHCYSSAGVTDAINQWLATETRPWQYLVGDYQWPARVSESGVCVELDELKPDHVLYFSNPQCSTGNWADQEIIDHINAVGCPVVYDCAYFGSTAQHTIPIPHNTEQVWFGFSKGWGMIGQRCGMVFAREPHTSFNPMQNVGCYDYSRIHMMREIINNTTPVDAWNTLWEQQYNIAKRLSATPSDSVMLVTTQDPYFAERVRDSVARVCISDLFEHDDLLNKNHY